MRTPIQLLAPSINGAAYESAPKLKAKPPPDRNGDRDRRSCITCN